MTHVSRVNRNEEFDLGIHFHILPGGAKSDEIKKHLETQSYFQKRTYLVHFHLRIPKMSLALSYKH